MKRERIHKTTRLTMILSFVAIDAYAEERRAKGDRILVSVADRKLVLFDGDRVLKIYDVAVGKPTTPTPVGEFKIVNRLANPTYYGHAQVVAPGKDNPLGTRWMGLSATGYGIHGTNVPSSIGYAASHGCIRMRQADLEQLFEMVSVGVTVEIRGDYQVQLAQVLVQ